ncbi:acetate/CoA ligase [Methanosalsum zhilinae DSM 4017]|uniref:Acetyl-coenzyme A synthetase n=1 Tax=Methanosalsum zhilinae (strain DSM 4017 / NBRC 107636 / OCM 62 / WeN5) TaxID=679901 RepID=F7XMR4_METZD|nr:acetate--CoA ligase [Methanosalsum zhilinae]AEH61088.1 acetate/CoA ligase [Methanosalsum zhilinae DSM 4017]
MEEAIESSLKEWQKIEPPEEFVKKANMNDPDIYDMAEKDYERFWEGIAENIDWYSKWKSVLEWEPPHARWFIEGKLNASYNCLDRHIDSRGDKTAIIWEGEKGDIRKYTYRQLLDATSRFANSLKDMGVKKGDIVTIYLPMIPEAVIAMLACARIGAPHSVVFAGFSADALAQRIENSRSKFLITCDGYLRRGKEIPHKKRADEGVSRVDTVDKVIVVRHTGSDVPMSKQRDVWWHEVMDSASTGCDPEIMDSEDMLFLMYTSGTTGKPKGVVHTTGGYMVGTHITTNWVFDIKEDDIYWCTADVGWITGHSYIVYGPLSNGATILIYEGAPDYPERDRFWDIVERHKVTIFYTAPTAIRAFMRWGEDIPAKHDLSTLRLLGTVGEPINPRAWLWYYENIGNKRCPVVDTWWQTETGMIMITPLPGITPLKPGSATRPFPGIKAKVLDDEGNEVSQGHGGYLALTRPWPSMIRTVYKNEQRFIDTYWSKWDIDTYMSEDGARRDEDSYFWILGRVDDVIKVAGHRLGTMEIESTLVSHPEVAEAAVVGKKDEVKGEVIVAYVTLAERISESDNLMSDLVDHVADEIGPIARPAHIFFTDELPKTRSGKIMRRILKSIADGEDVGDITTLQNPEIVEELKRKVDESGTN